MAVAVNRQRFEGGLIFLSGLLVYWPHAGLMPRGMAAKRRM
jgi:hypothetical protein